MKIACIRQLSAIEAVDLMHSARINKACGAFKGWARYRYAIEDTSNPDMVETPVDQKYEEDNNAKSR